MHFHCFAHHFRACFSAAHKATETDLSYAVAAAAAARSKCWLFKVINNNSSIMAFNFKANQKATNSGNIYPFL